MEIAEIEAVVGRLYLMIIDQQGKLAQKDAAIAALTPPPPMPPTIFSIASPRDADSA